MLWISAAGPEDGVGEELEEIGVVEIFGDAQGSIEDALVVGADAGPGDGLGVFGGDGGDQARDVRGRLRVFVELSNRREGLNATEHRMALRLFFKLQSRGEVFA